MVQCFNLQDATGVQCGGKTYLREGWLHRHYKTFIGHDPGQFHLDENSVEWIKWYSECFNLQEATEICATCGKVHRKEGKDTSACMLY